MPRWTGSVPDIVSVVIFDHAVDVLVPATKLTDKEPARRDPQSHRAGSTALAGVSKGAEEVQNLKDRSVLTV